MIATEQDRAKLCTLSLEFAGVLAVFPKLREELKAFDSTEDIAFDGLSDRLRITLEKAVDLQFEIEHLPVSLRDAPEMTAFTQRLKQAMGLQFVERFAVQFKGVCADIRSRFAQEQADVERQAKQKAEAERKAREKAETDRKARERAEQARRESEAKIQAAIPAMLAIPAGTFIMGCQVEEWETSYETVVEKGWFNSVAKQVAKRKLKQSARDAVEGGCYGSEKPAHQVKVAGFSIGKYPVTFAQFDAFCDLSGFAKPQDNGWGRGNCPVINVSWQDAQRYAAWLVEVTGKPFRLPSEAEWEYAARGGDGRYAFPWGQSIDSSRANYGNNVGKTTPVGQYPANGFGLHDMHGNVWEWCQDNWHGDYQGAPTTGVVWAGGDPTFRVLRGGSWLNGGGHCRSAFRSIDTPDYRNYIIGFRFALAQTPAVAAVDQTVILSVVFCITAKSNRPPVC